MRMEVKEKPEQAIEALVHAVPACAASRRPKAIEEWE